MSQILTIHLILEGVPAKNLEATLLFDEFTNAFDTIHRGKMEQILLAYGLSKETVAAIMMLYRNTKVKVHSPDGDTTMLRPILNKAGGSTPQSSCCTATYPLSRKVSKFGEPDM